LAGCGPAPPDYEPILVPNASVGASANSLSSPSGRGTVPGGEEPDSLDARARLRALETWAQSAPALAADTLILALEDKDEHIRARAMELIEPAFARTPEGEK
jgi:hypothetical protein